jgi:uncharacterized OsmC-like protein
MPEYRLLRAVRQAACRVHPDTRSADTLQTAGRRASIFMYVASPAAACNTSDLERSMDEKDFALRLTLEDGFRMNIDFGDDLPGLAIDEAPPLGDGAGPNPAHVLGGAIGGCLGASLLYCMRRARIDVAGMGVDVSGRVVRNDRGHWRVQAIRVRLEVQLPDEQRGRLARCISVFEDYCIVSESVRRGIPIVIEVEPVPLLVATSA